MLTKYTKKKLLNNTSSSEYEIIVHSTRCQKSKLIQPHNNLTYKRENGSLKKTTQNALFSTYCQQFVR